MEGFSPRTDLASERMRADTELRGVRLEKSASHGIETEVLTVSSAEGARAIGKPKGVYTTLSFPSPTEMDALTMRHLSELIGDTLEKTLLRLTGRRAPDELSLLAVGLGNRRLTADSVGTMTAERIRATAHIKEEMPSVFRRLGAAEIRVISPGVLSQSGMEASDAVASLVSGFPVDAVLVFDALAARSLSRVGRTVQIADSGIEPGSGIGNRRRALSRESLGVPVVSVGVPTVTDTATLVGDTLSALTGAELSDDVKDALSRITQSFVSPEDCDRISEKMAEILSDAVNLRFGVLL